MKPLAVAHLALILLGPPFTADAQPVPRIYRIGWLSGYAVDKPFRQGLRGLGYVEGQNLVIEARFHQGQPDRLSALAAELAALRVAVIVCPSTDACAAARKATRTIPIVMSGAANPLAEGLIASLARPGNAQFARIGRHFTEVERRFNERDRRNDGPARTCYGDAPRPTWRAPMTDSEYQRLVELLGTKFAEIDRRLTGVDRRFDESDRRIDSLAGRQEEGFRKILGHFDELYRRLERLEAESFAIVQALRRIETLIGSERAQREVLGQSVDHLRRQIADLQARLDAVEARLQG